LFIAAMFVFFQLIFPVAAPIHEASSTTVLRVAERTRVRGVVIDARRNEPVDSAYVSTDPGTDSVSVGGDGRFELYAPAGAAVFAREAGGRLRRFGRLEFGRIA
jgi:hypothetical protein